MLGAVTSKRIFPIAVAGLLAAAPRPVAAQEMTVAEPTVVLEGRVVDQRGEAVPAAEVRVAGARAPDVALRKVFSDGDGAFRAVVGRHEWHLLEVHAKGYAPRRLRVQHARWSDVRLQEAVAVRVDVRDADSRPVPHAAVIALPTAWIADAWCAGTTDEAGTAVLSDVAIAPQRLLAWIPGFGLASTALDVRGPCEVVIGPSSAPSTSLRVRVGLPPGSSPDAAEPRLWFGDATAPAAPPELAWRREDTVFVLDHVPVMDFRVELVAPGFTAMPRWAEFARDRGPYSAHFLCEPARELAWTAVVRDTEGKPIPGVRLLLGDVYGRERREAFSDGGGIARFASTLGSGDSFVLEVDDARWAFTNAWAPGVASGLEIARPAQRGRLEPGVAIEVRLQPAATIAGRVLDAGGRPAPNAQVTLELESPIHQLPNFALQARTRTGADGAFVFTGVDPRSKSARVRATVGTEAVVTDVFPVPGPEEQPAGELVVRLAPAATVEGVVSDGSGRPWAGLMLRLSSDDQAGVPVAHDAVLTDRLGRYRFAGITSAKVTLHFVNPDLEVHQVGNPFAVHPGLNQHDPPLSR